MQTRIKRIIKYILHGIPEVNIQANISYLKEENMLSGKNILITGGSKGLGKAIALKASAYGANVYILGRKKEDLLSVSKESNNSIDFLEFDLEDIDNIDIIAKYIEDNKINALVNNAGISLHEKSVFEVNRKDFERQFRINLEAPYFLTNSFCSYLLDNHIQGSIVNMVSERGLYCDVLPYGLTKSALISYTQGMARKVVRNNIRINAIAPGVTATDMTGYKEDGNLLNLNTCGGRIFFPEEVAELTCFLLSDRANSITGEVIACDQGNFLRSDW